MNEAPCNTFYKKYFRLTVKTSPQIKLQLMVVSKGMRMIVGMYRNMLKPSFSYKMFHPINAYLLSKMLYHLPKGPWETG